MHFYPFNIGDYLSHTQHLEPLEDIAYRRMLDYCYLNESGLPNNEQEIARLIRMRTHCECISVVLHEFFLFDEGTNCWYNQRVDKEIQKYRDKGDKAAKAAKARWNKDLNY